MTRLEHGMHTATGQATRGWDGASRIAWRSLLATVGGAFGVVLLATPCYAQTAATAAAETSVSGLPSVEGGGATEHNGNAIRPFRINVPEEALARSPAADGGDAMARARDRHGSIAGCAAGEDPGTRPVLGNRLRLAQGGGEAECAAAVRDDDRRGRHPVHPRPVSSSERDAADHDARLARLDLRAPQGRRSADRSHGPRRTCRRRLRSRPAHAPGYGFSGKPKGSAWGPDRMGRAWDG